MTFTELEEELKKHSRKSIVLALVPYIRQDVLDNCLPKHMKVCKKAFTASENFANGTASREELMKAAYAVYVAHELDGRASANAATNSAYSCAGTDNKSSAWAINWAASASGKEKSKYFQEFVNKLSSTCCDK